MSGKLATSAVGYLAAHSREPASLRLAQNFSPMIFLPRLGIRQIRLAAVSYLIAFALVSTLLPSNSFAEVAIVGNTPGSRGALITGTITAQDAKRIVEREKRGARLALVRLDSSGGDVIAAMTIGRILRKNGGIVLVEEDDICASACVLIIAGAVVRSIHGKVLIHRPYSQVTDTAGQDLAAWDKKMKSFRKQVEAYLSERTYQNFCVKGFGADLSTAEGVACDERPTRWASRVHVTPAG